VHEFKVDPSSRNKRVIKAYRKAGFVTEKHQYPAEKSDYGDTYILIKRINTEPEAEGDAAIRTL
jgi:RimJ/RimL family protein N-acetyltransferase